VQLGLNLGQWGAGNATENLRLVRAADRLGYRVVWVAEAYGTDVPAVLGWLVGHTERIDLGAGVMQIPARSPAMTAMTAATLDALSGGRFRLGLGVSGPQVSEGWHGVRFDKPLARTREYVSIVNAALRRERVRFEGVHYQLPLPDGPGKPMMLALHPVRSHIPVYLASIGPKNLELTGEIADGWLSIFFSVGHAAEQLERLRVGRARRGLDLAGFDVVANMPIVVGDAPEVCAAPVRAFAALYLGGMGSRDQNFYHALASRMGFGVAADEVQRAYLSRDYAAAAAAVPFEFLDATSLLGPPERIAARLREVSDAGVTTLSLLPMAPEVDDRIEALRICEDALTSAVSQWT
jgi:F420-dependent oxidoreductase-like protein